MNLIKISGFNVNNEHMITRIGQYLGWGDAMSIPREQSYECSYSTEYCFNMDYLEGYDSLKMIAECVSEGLKVDFFGVIT